MKKKLFSIDLYLNPWTLKWQSETIPLRYLELMKKTVIWYHYKHQLMHIKLVFPFWASSIVVLHSTLLHSNSSMQRPFLLGLWDMLPKLFTCSCKYKIKSNANCTNQLYVMGEFSWSWVQWCILWREERVHKISAHPGIGGSIRNLLFIPFEVKWTTLSMIM